MRDRTVRLLSALHTALYRLSGGRIGRRLVDNDMLLLTTRGEVSGDEHTVPLLYLRDADRLVVIASYGGRDRHPQWFRNLRADPEVRVQVGGRRLAATARVASPHEREVWFQRAVAAYSGYADYAGRTDRAIPIVFLEPTEG